LKPGTACSHRHWHESEDELVYILEGEVMLCESSGETLLRAGDAAGFKAGVPDGHCLVNRTDRDAVCQVQRAGDRGHAWNGHDGGNRPCARRRRH